MTSDIECSALKRLDTHLLSEYGPLMDSKALCKVLYFRSAHALSVAHSKGRLTFPVFNLPGRRGVFARTLDVSAWLADMSSCTLASSGEGQVATMVSSRKNTKE